MVRSESKLVRCQRLGLLASLNCSETAEFEDDSVISQVEAILL